jgi:hypothetical protein
MKVLLLSLLILSISASHYQSPQKYVTSEYQAFHPDKTAPTIERESLGQKASHYFLKAIGPEFLATWILVLAAIVGILYTIKTLRAIEREVNLQQAAMAQWIVLENWSHEVLGQNPDRSDHVRIRFEVNNPTGWPIALESLEITIAGQITNFEPQMLLPKDPHRMSHDIKFDNFPRTSGQVSLDVISRAVYDNILKERIPQEITGLLVCTPIEATFFPQSLVGEQRLNIIS